MFEAFFVCCMFFSNEQRGFFPSSQHLSKFPFQRKQITHRNRKPINIDVMTINLALHPTYCCHWKGTKPKHQKKEKEMLATGSFFIRREWRGVIGSIRSLASTYHISLVVRSTWASFNNYLLYFQNFRGLPSLADQTTISSTHSQHPQDKKKDPKWTAVWVFLGKWIDFYFFLVLMFWFQILWLLWKDFFF